MGTKGAKQRTTDLNGGVVALTKELFPGSDYAPRVGRTGRLQTLRLADHFSAFPFAAVRPPARGARGIRRRQESDYFGDKKAIHDSGEYRRLGAFVIPEAAWWENLRKAAQADDIKV